MRKKPPFTMQYAANRIAICRILKNGAPLTARHFHKEALLKLLVHNFLRLHLVAALHLYDVDAFGQ